ncbi:amidohydrolase family protein [Botrimarina hoheduenensis]|uniref:Amidohydrolase n=1 Tax=Botrimarina hoheduenensis TaxID=2528000 RepID=A0A5C5VSV0_9BACT|nr:amidohydrolase family protein [Botrimarina hoheduenensis]TWT40652.1 Amidohydrolase [Botrimarina hoheduenensis]
MILDSHHHLWRYSPAEYGWISAEMSVLARDFGVADLEAAAASYGVVGSVAVQARQTVEETGALLTIAESGSFIRGVVGWAPLADPAIAETLDGWAGRPKLRGIRHVVQDEPDDAFLDRPDFNRGVAEVLRRGLTYDLLIFAKQLPAALRFVDRHPEGRIVLDHIAKPSIKEGLIQDWRAQLTELARRPNVTCKVSGVVTEADWNDWTETQVRPYLDAALEAFGPERLMYGSDWPVCLLATDYPRWLRLTQAWVADWSESQRESFFSGAATAAYQLNEASA